MSTLPVLLIGALVFWIVFVFNRLVRLRNRARGSWSDIDVQLKRRHDLVDNLVEVVKAYVTHERETLEKVTLARAAAENARVAGDPGQAGSQETRLSGGVRGLYAVAEAYPDLKASERFLDLQRGLTDLEDDLQNARRYYNAVVRDFNTRVEVFPDLLVARTLGFRDLAFFELEDRSQGAAPEVKL